MKTFFRFLALLTLVPAVCFAQVPGLNLWEKAAYGSFGGIQRVLVQGWNPALTTTFEDVSPESSALAIPTAALTTPYCASANANDTSAGTGARTISLTVVNTSFVETTETVTMSGQTSASLATTSVLGFNGGSILTAGSGNGNAGVIDCGDGTNTAGSAQNAYLTIPAFSATAVPAAGAGGGNVAPVFSYIVPAGYTLVCRNIQVGSVFATAASGMDAVIDGATNLGLLKRLWFKMIHNTGTNPSFSPEYLVIPEKTYFKGKLAGVTGSNVGPASMTMECLRIATSSVGQNLF